MLARMWSHGNFHSLLVEIEYGTDTLEESWTVSYKTKYTLIIWSSNSSPCIYPKKLKTLVQLSSSVMSDYLWPYGLQHARLPCPSPSPGAGSNSCPSSQWCHPTISSSVVPFSFCLQSLPASRSFPKSQFLASGGQSTGVSASASVFPMNSQDWFPLGWTGWISL